MECLDNKSEGNTATRNDLTSKSFSGKASPVLEEDKPMGQKIVAASCAVLALIALSIVSILVLDKVAIDHKGSVATTASITKPTALDVDVQPPTDVLEYIPSAEQTLETLTSVVAFNEQPNNGSAEIGPHPLQAYHYKGYIENGGTGLEIYFEAAEGGGKMLANIEIMKSLGYQVLQVTPNSIVTQWQGASTVFYAH